MALTFREFREIVAPFSGRAGGLCASSPKVAVFARDVMHLLLFNGASEAIREVKLIACDGLISLPPEVEVPLKAKVNYNSIEVRDHAATFHSQSANCDSWPAAERVLAEDGNRTPLDHAFPKCGAFIAVQAHCQEENCFVQVQGKDISGREVYTMFRGEHVTGVKFELEKGKIKYSDVEFGEITSVQKSETSGYVSAFAVSAQTQKILRFVADWSPSEINPSRRRCRLVATGCPNPAEISVLCRIRLKDRYSDGEITLFDNSIAIMLAAQRLQAEKNNDLQTANYKNQAVQDMLDHETGYKKKPGTPADIYFPMSGGSVKNIC